ncbi:MAG: penicillin-binding protein 1C [Bacillota bacterium]
MKKKILIYSIILILITAGGVLWFIELPAPFFLQDYSTVVQDINGKYLRVFLNENEQWCFPPDEREIPYKLKTAVVNYEDKRFYSHPGIDIFALGRAISQNIRAGEVESGASTLTMQVLRLSRPKDRTIKNKLIEMVQALKLDFKYSKEDIFKMYLTHAPYGGNIIGYRAASLRYFGKSPDEITWGEAAILAVLPNGPGRINPMNGREILKTKRDRLLNKLYNEGVFDQQTLKLALAEKIPDEQLPFDLSVPLLSRKLKSDYDKDIIQTTIDKDIQENTRDITGQYMELMKDQGINNCAVLIADTRTGAVKAYIGSNDFYDLDNAGRIDGVQMLRSSGSILKPFLYGLAMDEGLIIPQSKVKDIPVSYGAYTPYNSDGSFSGIVSAGNSLINSLNAPAVSLLDEYGVNNFYEFLIDADLRGMFRSSDQYGLPLILGGAEISLWDAASMYYSLGNYGDFNKLHVLTSDNGLNDSSEINNIHNDEKNKNQLISKGSSYLILDVLKEVKRPGMEYYWKEYSSNRQIAWKTGTSYGNRDAWALGVSPDWTVAVWVGNFSGVENKNLTGLDAAGPLFFRLFNSLDKDNNKSWFDEPDDLKEIEVSASTGYQIRKGLNELTKTITVKAPASAKPLRYSPYEKMIYVNNDETEEVCSLCWEVGNYKKIYKLAYPPDVIDFLNERGNNNIYSLPHNRDCPSTSGYNPIEFIYPKNGNMIMIPRGIDGTYQKVKFKIAYSYDDNILYWYLDNNYLGKTVGKHHKLLLPSVGWHRLYVIDERGNHREIKFYVERSG